MTVDGKIYRESLKTTVFSVAKQKLPDYVKEELRKKRQSGAPASFAEARKLFEQDLENDHALSESMKRYRRYCIKKLLPSAEILPTQPIDPPKPLPRICDVPASYVGRTAGTNTSSATVFKCPTDKVGLFAAEGPSYEWNAELNGHRIDETRTADAC